MTLVVKRNLAHKRRPGRREVLLLACILTQSFWFGPVAPAETRAGAPSATPVPTPPPIRPPEIVAAPLPSIPAAGKGRLAFVIGGNHRWCTYPDDRLIRPAEKLGQFEKRNEVFTFGYTFTVSAVKRGKPGSPLMLFESPVFRTAEWRPASKLGLSVKTGPAGPTIGVAGEPPPRLRQVPKTPQTLVPFWTDEYRCVTLPGQMDFDLDPGTYDVYIAFDLLNREGGWVHRMSSYLTDVPVEAARRTRLDGIIDVGATAERQVELESWSVEPDANSPEPAGP